jgi:hypothetical protein
VREALVAVSARHPYLGFKNRKAAGYLLASAFQEEREHLGARKTVATLSEVRTPYCYGSGTKAPKAKADE